MTKVFHPKGFGHNPVPWENDPDPDANASGQPATSEEDVPVEGYPVIRRILDREVDATSY